MGLPSQKMPERTILYETALGTRELEAMSVTRERGRNLLPLDEAGAGCQQPAPIAIPSNGQTTKQNS
jgi:hypothetical protein